MKTKLRLLPLDITLTATLFGWCIGWDIVYSQVPASLNPQGWELFGSIAVLATFICPAYIMCRMTAKDDM